MSSQTSSNKVSSKDGTFSKSALLSKFKTKTITTTPSNHVVPPPDFPPTPQHKDGDVTPQQHALYKRDRAGEVIDALNEGKLPTTNQITKTIEKIEDKHILHDAARNMSPIGKKLVSDTEHLLDITKIMLAEKNEKNQLQKVIYHSQLASKQLKETGKVGTTKDILNSESQKSALLLRDASVKASNIARLIATSSEFRKLLNDLNLILQEIFYSRLPQEAQGTGNLDDIVRGTTNMVLDKAKDIVRPHVEAYKQGELDGREATQRTTAVASSQFKAKLADLKLTPEQRDHISFRFQNLMHDIQESTEYRQALDDLLDILSELSEQVGTATSQTKDVYSTDNSTKSGTFSSATIERFSNKNNKHLTHASVTSDAMNKNIAIAIQNAKELVENFSNHQSLDPLIAVIKEFVIRLRNDQDLRLYMDELKYFIHLSLTDPDFLIQQEYIPMGSSMIERGRFILTNSYQDLTSKLIDQIQNFNYNMQRDRISNTFAKDLETLTSDLFLDARGRPTFKYELIKDLTKIVPILAKRMEYIPLPRIEGSDEEFDFILDNMVITCSNILPKHVQVRTETDMESYSGFMRNNVTFRILNIRAEAKDIAFYYKKKKGFAKLTDVGLIDLIMPKEGISVIMTIAPSTSDEHTFIAEHVETQIKDLKIKIHDSHHNILYKMFGSIINSKIRKQLETVITEKIYNFAYKFDGKITHSAQKLRAMSLTQETDKESSVELTPEWSSKAFNVHERI